uniref:ABC transporter domain-containing protein n=1 Tax=Chaetoceros debilis TaxID=122233 RepID=A0A7S3VH76_9STRA|mmetsp:Transcript_11446/g.16681  ORF Transcript_11446/g.16681 Transcript_11446/m.16681 type:complete len:633 (+) Transcript_11446:162-2060(+)|eukprot:CAMPEP_0194083776 /NCGR_PEP_ID=MMETSP0149-20130528/9756_1 /TAXON_ID=122233 /ORGANISM="Chaetoceros debilis, Strain MM31A-1" /LENGTH=632 /DNA_ID=CAMNT_0038766231 /DNA_START=77 /DNA_END=1975 /DNA_ORIENTATION=+
MKFSSSAFLFLLGVQNVSGFSIAPTSTTTISQRTIHKNSSSNSGLFSASVEAPPTETEEVYGTIVGDTKGAALRLSKVAISRGASPLLKNIDWSVQPNERWGIVGINGAGKSTLLGAITGTVRMDTGAAYVHSNIRVGYLRQSAVSGSTRTVYEEAKSEMTLIEDARVKLESATKIVEDGDYSEEALNELAEAEEEFQTHGGYEQEQMVDSVLKGLGFEPEDSDELCADFSGGWQMRIALARLLLSKPSLLLLDEPSNHLDSAAKDWLGKYIANYDGSVVLVSHDVGLMDASVNSIAEITAGTLLEYRSCTYHQYLDEKVFRAESAQAQYQKNLEEAANLQAFIDKFSAGTKSKSAQSRVKMLEKMKQEGKLTPPPVAIVTTARIPELVLPPPPKPYGENLMVLKNASIGYDPNEEPLLTNINLEIPRGMKLLLRGPNGAGKSTLLKALRGNVESMIQEGSREENVQLKLGVFTQDLAQELDKDSTAVDLVTSYAREGADGDVTITDQAARSVMGRLGLGGEKPLRKIAALSGGEKARVALSMFALKASNLLMLDEPSNHLDVGCIQGLANALSGWGGKDGAVVVISHDREFCEKVGFTHIGTVTNGGIVLEQRPLQESDWEQYDIGSSKMA